MKRQRIHPGNSSYFRFDKGFHFLSMQSIVGFDGLFYHIAIGKGHNNDKGMFILSKIGHTLEEKGIHLLADQGYCDSYTNLKVCYNQYECARRTIVENLFSRVHSFKMASSKCCINIDKHYFVISIIFNLVNIIKFFELDRLDELNEILHINQNK